MFHVQMLTLIFVCVRMSANDALGRCDAVAMATVMEIAVLSTGAEHGVIIVEQCSPQEQSTGLLLWSGGAGEGLM